MCRPPLPADMDLQRWKALPMTTLLTVTGIDGKQLEEAYALIRTLAPEVTLARWLDFATPIADAGKDKGGVLGVFGEDGSMFGLLTWRKEDCLRYGRVLIVENLVTFELSRAAPARKALSGAVKAIARKEQCSAVRLIVAGRGLVDPGSDKASGWTSLGLEAEGVIFTRKMDCCCGDAELQAEAESLLSA